MKPADLEQCVFRVLDPHGATVGTGFLIGPDLAVTCAHVVQGAGGEPGAAVTIEFHLGGVRHQAWVLERGWSPPDEDDVAFFQVEDLPEQAQPVDLGRSEESHGHRYVALGYLPDGPVQVRRFQGHIGELVPVSGVPHHLLQLQGAEIDPGLSGAPVLDAETGHVVGMVLGYRDVVRNGGVPGMRLAYAVPAETLHDLYPETVLPLPFWQEEVLAAYRRRVLNETRFVNLAGIPLPKDRDGRPIPLRIPLEKVYIRLQAIPEMKAIEERERERRALEEEAEEQRRGLAGLLRRGTGGRSSTPPRAADALAVLRVLGEYLYRRAEVYRAEERPEPVDPEKALQEHKRLVVLGAPGAGKTTLLQYLARRAAERPDGPIPIRVSLRDYATFRGTGGTSTLQAFALERAAGGDEKLRRALERSVEEGQVLWLVDALDEARGWRGEAAREAATLKGSLVVTSRPVGYERAGLEALPHFEVLPLSPADVEQFFRDWFGVLAGARGEDAAWVEDRVVWLKKQLEERPRVAALVRNPLLLTFLVVLAGEEGKKALPEHRADLYRRYIEELLTTWEYRRRPREGAEGKPAFRLGPLEDRQARDAALQGVFLLGWRMHLIYHGSRGEELPSRKSLTTYLAERLKPRWALSEGDAQAVADAVLSFWEEAGLIDRWYIEGTEYLAFRHLTFQEYAAARVLCDLWQERPKRTWAFLRPRLHHPHWHEVLLLMAAMLDDATTLIERVRKARSAYERELHRDLFLAAEMVGEGAPVQEGLRKELAHALQRLLSSWPRRLFLVVLGVTFLSGPIAGWYVLSSARCAFVLLLIGWVFIWLGCALGIFPRLRALLWFPSRAFAPAPVRRKHVVRSLGQLGEVALAPLLQALRDKNSDVREAAAQALGQLGDPRALEPLLHALKDENRHVREAAAQAVGRLSDVALEPLLHALRDEKPWVRQVAAQALDKLGWRPTQPVEKAWYLLARRQWNSLVQLGDVALESLLHALRDESWRVREAAAQALGQLGDPRALEPLLHALKDENRRVRQAAAQALGQLGDPRALEPLLQALRDEKPWVRQAAARALGQLGDPRALPALLHALRDRDAGVRWAAAQALGRLGDPRALAPLLQALRNEDRLVREAAAQALGQLGDVDLEPLLQVLRDKDSDVREAAAKALGQLGDPRALDPLLLALRDGNRDVREAAAEALGLLVTRINDRAQCRRVARALWWRLTDVEDVARAALAALQQAATRLTELTVESLPFDDPLLPGQLPRWKDLLNKSQVGVSIVLSALAGLVGGIISNNFTNVPLLWAVIVFVLALLLQIVLALRQPSEASP